MSDLNDRKRSTRQVLHPDPFGLCRLGIYVNNASDNLFYADYETSEFCTNRIKPTRVWLDEKGIICAEVDRRSLTQMNNTGE